MVSSDVGVIRDGSGDDRVGGGLEVEVVVI